MAHRYKDLNLTQLRAFCEFVRQRSFTDAARTLHVSHSAVWQQVRALERRFDVTLLERQGRAWRPTGDGEALLDAISEILHSVDGLEDRFRRLRGDLPRTLTIVASPGAILSELNRPVVELRKRRPNCRVCITVSASMEQTTEQLLTGTVDFAIVPQSIAGQIPLRRSLMRTVVSSRPAVVAVPADHALAKRRSLRLTDLIRTPLILPSPEHLWRRRVDDTFREAGLLDELNVVLETSLNQAMRRWVGQGLGIAAFPRTDDGVEYPGIVLKPAEHLFPAEDVVAIRRRGPARPEVQLFEQLLLRHAR